MRLYESDLNSLFIDFGLLFNLRQKMNIIHNDLFEFTSTLDFTQIEILAKHDHKKVGIGNGWMCVRLYFLNELLKLVIVIGD